ncbi:MAG: N-acetyltransferase family protein [Saprospiraceae bacterium]
MSFQIKSGTIAEAVALSQLLPEFINPRGEDEYHKRLTNVRHLILIAYHADQPIGFKLGYEKEDYFYSWMGGVLPDFRKSGIAKALADRQETWAREQGFTKVIFKTRNSHVGMLIFALKNGFQIISVTQKEQLRDYRILLEKKL